MAHGHLDTLSAADESYLHRESATTQMHIGGVALFDGTAPSHEDFVAHVTGRLSLVPRYRQRVVAPPGGLGRHRWVDDRAFDIDFHIRREALPPPGGDDELRLLAAQVFSQRLDRARPLWELLLVEGFASERFAIINKTHHTLIDGVSGVDLMTVLFDATREPRVVEQQTWAPRRAPSAASLSASVAEGYARTAAGLTESAARAARRPRGAFGKVSESLSAMTESTLSAALRPMTASPLNVAIGAHRRLAFAPTRLDDFKLVKTALGGTVNDVVLTVVAGALRAWYESRGLATSGVTLRAGVPVSTRSAQDAGEFGNQVSLVVAPLPLQVADPVERLDRISKAMLEIKRSRQAVGAKTMIELQGFAPATILAQASRLPFSDRLYNVVVTNVPGPQLPLYILGHELTTLYPLPPLIGDRAVAIAVISYNGAVSFGLLGDYDALPDIDVIAEGVQSSLAELVERAAALTQ